MTTIAVLPVKRFNNAKRRLGVRLSPGTRRLLAEAMVTDVLTALRRARHVDGVVVVTSEHAAEAIARGHGADSIPDTGDDGHNPAAVRGVAWAVERGARRVLLVPGDCPALAPKELDELLGPRPAPSPEVVLVPDRHGTGTNGLLVAPPDAISPSFGAGSCERHRELARAAGASCRLERPASLLLDIDTGEDLAVLRERLAGERERAPRTRSVLGLPHAPSRAA
jgi:2-phospho-L-lactate guanylyltransferase